MTTKPRSALEEENRPREYLMDDPEEVKRLYRECAGYLRTCHKKHGTDWEGRKFAIEALEKAVGITKKPPTWP